MKSGRQSPQSKTTHLALPEHFWQNSVSFWALLHWRGVFDAGTKNMNKNILNYFYNLMAKEKKGPRQAYCKTAYHFNDWNGKFLLH